MTKVLFDDWSKLPGTSVEMWRYGKWIGTGLVEIAASDSMAWIRTEPLAERYLLDKTDGMELRVSREQVVHLLQFPPKPTT